MKIDSWKCDVCNVFREEQSEGWFLGGFNTAGLDGVFITPFSPIEHKDGLALCHFCGIACAVKWCDAMLKKQVGGGKEKCDPTK